MNEEQATRHDVPRSAGLLTGIVIGSAVFMVGLLLSLTGIGAVVGIPMMLMGLATPAYGFFHRYDVLRGPCPHCHFDATVGGGKVAFRCTVCKRRIGVRGETFVGIE